MSVLFVQGASAHFVVDFVCYPITCVGGVSGAQRQWLPAGIRAHWLPDGQPGGVMRCHGGSRRLIQEEATGFMLCPNVVIPAAVVAQRAADVVAVLCTTDSVWHTGWQHARHCLCLRPQRLLDRAN